MKPVEPNRLVKAVDKVQKLKGTAVLQEKFTYLLQSLEKQEIERISISSKKGGISILPVKDIIYIMGSGTYSTFFMVNGNKFTASKNLGHFHSLLPEKVFFRVHQSYQVNINYVQRVLPGEGVLELSNGEQVPIAKSRQQALLDLL